MAVSNKSFSDKDIKRRENIKKAKIIHKKDEKSKREKNYKDLICSLLGRQVK